MRRKLVATLAATALASGLLTACSTAQDHNDKPLVLTTFTILADMAAASDADLVLGNGLGLEHGLDKLLTHSTANRVVATDGIEPISIENTNTPNPRARMSPALAKVYVDNIINVRHGRIRALIGTNGSGKSTLFKALMGLEQPHSGRIINAHPEPGAVAYVPQSEAVDWNFPLSVRDVVASGRMAGRHGRWFRRLSAKDREIVDSALERTGLTDFRDRQIGQLSGGQK